MNEDDKAAWLPGEDPAAMLLRHYAAVWQRGEPPISEINPALTVETIGFVRQAGDWLGVVISPWFLRLYLLPGGGSLWGEIPLGQRRYLELPGGTLPFSAAEEAGLGCYQYSTLIAPMGLVPDMAAARRIARDALQAFVPGSLAGPEAGAAVAPGGLPGVSRRAFFRRLVGKR